MTFAELKAQFSALLNRRDLTSSLTTTFYGMATQRIQRELRVPAMETLLGITTDGTDTLAVPGDLLEVIGLFVNTSTIHQRLIKTDLQTIQNLRHVTGDFPTHYHRIGGNFIIGPVPGSGDTVYVHYYEDASTLSADSDTNWLTDTAPDLLIYGMLSYAADYYADDRLRLFEDRYQSIAKNLQEMANSDELANASIRPAYTTEEVW